MLTKFSVSKPELEALYIDQRLSAKSIGRQFGYSSPAVFRALRRYGITVRNCGRDMKGSKNPCYGKPVSMERRKKTADSVRRAWDQGRCKPMPKGSIGHPHTIESRKKIGLAQTKFFAEHPERRRQVSNAMKEKWCDPDIRDKLILGSISARVDKPNKLESRVIKIMEEYHLPYRYCGDGSVIVGFLKPDFVNIDGQKKLIEVFGNAYHDPKKAIVKIRPHSLENNRKKIFHNYGFDTLVLWEDDIKKSSDETVAERIRDFTKASTC